MTKQNYLNIVEQANTIPVAQIAPELVKEVITEEQIVQFVMTIANTHGITDQQAFIAITLLFLKGACNSSAPKQMAVDITVNDQSNPVNITKYDIEYACHTITGNTYLRRFAQAMSKEISEYAANNNLNGDLAIRLNNLALSKGGPPLNSVEKAWANSFCQNRTDISSYAGDRLASLLAEDFQKRFGNKKDKKSSSNKEQPLTPRQWRMGKPKKEVKKDEVNTQPGTTSNKNKKKNVNSKN